MLKEKLKTIKEIIETSYSIGDYVEKYEQYQEQVKAANVLQGITNLMIPEFKEFIANKFKEAQDKLEQPEIKQE